MSHRIGTLLGLAILASTLTLTSPVASSHETEDCASDADRIAALEAYLAGTPEPLPVVARQLARLKARYADDCVALNQIQQRVDSASSADTEAVRGGTQAPSAEFYDRCTSDRRHSARAGWRAG